MKVKATHGNLVLQRFHRAVGNAPFHLVIRCDEINIVDLFYIYTGDVLIVLLPALSLLVSLSCG